MVVIFTPVVRVFFINLILGTCSVSALYLVTLGLGLLLALFVLDLLTLLFALFGVFLLALLTPCVLRPLRTDEDGGDAFTLVDVEWAEDWKGSMGDDDLRILVVSVFFKASTSAS